MSKVITFSRFFPSYHNRKGEPTFFVEKIWKYIWDAEKSGMNPLYDYQPKYDDLFHPMGSGITNVHEYTPKLHTIRNGSRWKVGDKFSPRVWSGKPYNSKQIIICSDLEVKKVFDIEIYSTGEVMINGKFFCSFGSKNWHLLCLNDGLSSDDMRNWFSKLPFKGQVICWDENVNYNK